MEILKEREKTHGDYTKVAMVAQKLKNAMFDNEVIDPDLNYVQNESLDLICTKMARIVCGNPDNKDSWVDIVGYAQLVVNSLDDKPIGTLGDPRSQFVPNP